MDKPVAVRTVLLVLLVIALYATWADAQAVPALENINSQAELDRAVAALDTALFDSYNRCDLEKSAAFFVDDVEFYHDQGGLNTGQTATDRQHKEEYLRQSDQRSRFRESAGLLHEGLWCGGDGGSPLPPLGT